MGSREFTQARTVVARLPFGTDLLEAILQVAEEHGVEAGALSAIGALQRARLSFYDQAPAADGGRVYRPLAINGPAEIVSLSGTVSRRDGRRIVHAHACLADESGHPFGGHVETGCLIFACELVLTEFVGPALDREYDTRTGLHLWRGLGEEDGVGRGT